MVDHVVFNCRIDLRANEDAGIAKVAVLPNNAFQRHRGALGGLIAPGGIAGKEGADINAIAAAEAFFMPEDVFSDVKAVGRPEAAGKQAAPPYRRAAGIEDLIEDGLDFLYISLNG